MKKEYKGELTFEAFIKWLVDNFTDKETGKVDPTRLYCSHELFNILRKNTKSMSAAQFFMIWLNKGPNLDKNMKGMVVERR